MTTEPDTPVLIAGTGIGGLATLLTMHDHGIARRPSNEPVCWRLREWGDDLAAISITPQRHDFYDSNGMLLWREPLGVGANLAQSSKPVGVEALCTTRPTRRVRAAGCPI